jgi:hypothetical protein
MNSLVVKLTYFKVKKIKKFEIQISIYTNNILNYTYKIKYLLYYHCININ